jgi:hypothetical protein
MIPTCYIRDPQEPADQWHLRALHKIVLNEFYRVAFRKKVYRSIDELQADLDLCIREYNEQKATSRTLVLLQNAHADLP